ncbi:hypothetical protein LSH36_274g06049 [Paralvinella palmiformis]|uniref:E3 ubiquitin-protein transferase MAEA n=1 Tax=Paralvinella palmiformis TaxID=53620 RepID=A0AAD9JJ94_9ANNE|nr:hypothetical protein LSH36_274g06049 [Paralvinella palmiformis]
MADLKALEHPTLKVPYELLNKKFRAAQKNVDREAAHVHTSVSELEKCLKQSSTVGDVTKVLDGMVEKLTLLKRKAEESINDEQEAAKACKRRIEHLKEYENLPPGGVNQWKKKRLDRMLVEYCLRAGYYNTAVQLARHSGIENLTNIELFLVSKEVEESLGRGETMKCLNWCHDNKSRLRRMKSTLEFNLRQQEFIEYIRNNKRLEAVKHARKYFSNLDDAQMNDVQKVMGLLAYPPDTELAPYKILLDPDRWQALVSQFRQENFKLYQLSHHSVFSITLQAGLSALKTLQCYKEDGTSRNPNCPTCNKHMNQLAKDLPYAHCAQSRLICAISGQPLNENNPPMMLPNGHVYGQNSLVMMAAENDSRVVCPQTKEIFKFEEAEKVFVM